jgi:cytochrome c biogenesis protein CcmG, thiol:disulfide interchange protein DsbE
MLMYRFLAISAILALLAGPGTCRAAVSDPYQRLQFNLYPVPCPANNLILKDLRGAPVNLAALRNKVVILNFWKIDCPPCSREKPILERIFRKYGPRGLAVVSVNLFDDPAEQRRFVQSAGYSFTFAFDADRLLSIRPQRLASGATTNFVVNSRAEAIYEISGVPTTYLIDRQGLVVGNSAGMVNWEQDQLAELLESLLAAPSTAAGDRDSDWFSAQARQGSGAAGPVARPSGPPVRIPQAPTDLGPIPAESPSRLPFQGAGPIQQPRSSPSGDTRGTTSEGVDGSRQHLVEPTSPTPKPAGQPKRSAAKPGTRPDLPGQSRERGAAAGTAHKPGAKRQPFGSTATGPETTIPGSPLTTQTGTPGGPVNPPSLPPAVPYTRQTPGAVAPSRGLVPDTDGTVQATIPGSGTPGTPFGGVDAGPGLPAAQPMGAANPISGFIMDSFEHSPKPTPIAPPGGQGAPVQRRPAATGQGAPASGLLGQLSQDVQNLGAGIKDVFQRLVPAPAQQ